MGDVYVHIPRSNYQKRSTERWVVWDFLGVRGMTSRSDCDERVFVALELSYCCSCSAVASLTSGIAPSSKSSAPTGAPARLRL